MGGGGGSSGTMGRIGSQQRGLGSYTAALAQGQNYRGQDTGGQALFQMASGQLTDYQNQAFSNQLSAIDLGQQGAINTTREQAAARGMYSSTSALQAENQIPLQTALARANIYGQQAQTQQQGILQGTALRGNLLGQAGNLYSGATSSYAAADQSQNTANSNMMQGILGAGALVAAPFTGGASLAAYGATQGSSYYNPMNQSQSLNMSNPYQYSLYSGGR
jgi:hypothetical protein